MKKLLLTLAVAFIVCLSSCNKPAETKDECCTDQKEAEAPVIDQSKVVDLVYQVQIKPEFKDDILKIFETMVTETRKEKGCIVYDLFQNQEDSANLILIEKWATQEDLDNHSNSEHFKNYIKDSDGKYEIAQGKKVKPVY